MDFENRTFEPHGRENLTGGFKMARKKVVDVPVDPNAVVDEEVAERVKQSMEDAGLTHRDVAAAIGSTEKVVYGWGRLGQISKHKLPAFCDLVGVREGWLLTGRGSRVYEQAEADHGVIEFRRPVSEKISPANKFVIRDCRIADVVDIHHTLPDKPIKSKEAYREVREGVLRNIYDNPNEWTSMPVPLLDSNSVGLPHFGIQVLTREHEPMLPLGNMVAFTMDLLPERGDFCIMARRPKGGGMWTISAGHFYMSHRVIVHDHQEFYESTHLIDQGIKMRLFRTPDTASVDPFEIDCFEDEWLLIGVGVYSMGWLNPVGRISQTRLDARLQRRLAMRVRR